MTSALRTGIFILMLFVITSSTLTIGTNTVSEIDNIAERIVLLEEQIDKKDELVEFYKKKDWGVNAAKQEKAKQELVDKLFALKEKQVTEGKSKEAASIEIYKTWGKAAFRVMLLLISVLITRRLFKF